MDRSAPPGRWTRAEPATTAAQRPVLVVDDDPRFRASLAEVLREAGHTTTEAGSGEDALAAARLEPPMLVLLDVHLPGLSGYEVCRRLMEEHGEQLPVVFVSGVRTESFDRVAGLLVGARDYLVKPIAPDELVVRLEKLVGVPGRANGDNPGLTKRELEVLGLLAAGLSTDEIARDLVISPKTVGAHLEHVFRKLRVRTQAQAVASAYQLGLVGAGHAPAPR